MSSNKPYLPITRANYEEAFLLYTDGELNEEGMSAVEAFVILHPDLQEELDILLSTKLDAEVFNFEGKERLLAENVKATVIDDALLLYIDNELVPEEKIAIEKRLAGNKDYQAAYEALMATKLVADRAVVFPNKTELYRHTEKRLPQRLWLRIAAAVILLLGIALLWTSIDINKTGSPAVVQIPSKSIKQEDIGTLKTTIKEPASAAVAVQESKDIKSEKREISAHTSGKKEPALLQSPLNRPDVRDRVIALHESHSDGLNMQKVATEKGVAQQQIINSQAVTTVPIPAYNTVDDAATTETMVSHAVAISNDDKKGSVRGFLRKASRFIERRTGINPVNENDELLIGVVALKLK